MPHLNFAPLHNGLAALEASVADFGDISATASGLQGEAAAALDRALYMTERALTRASGLPRRPWYVHHIYAPGFYTGYGVKTLPGVREALEQRTWGEAQDQIEVAGTVLTDAAAAIDKATELATAGSS